MRWIGGEPPAVERLAARGPVLVHFFDVGHLSSVRTLPYLTAWQERYAGAGLSVLGVNSPRFPFTADPGKLGAALARLTVQFPVAADSDHSIWRGYGCEGWPSSFLWGTGGLLRWFQFGEGEYGATEEEIRSLLPPRARDAGLPDPVEPLRPSDAAGARVVPPTAEVFPGGGTETPWRVAGRGPAFELAYEGAGAAVTLDGTGEVDVSLDGEGSRPIEITAPGVYELADYERHGKHHLRLAPSPGLDVWCVAFAPGVR